MNTPRNATNSGQQVVWHWQGSAFGLSPADEDPYGDGINTIVNLRFPGQYYDAESGLHYNWNRYYDTRTGRYITSDPIGIQGGLNTYGYGEANPVVNTDRYGLAVPSLGPRTSLCQSKKFPKMPPSVLCKDKTDCVEKCHCEHEVRLAQCGAQVRCIMDSVQKQNTCLLGCSAAAGLGRRPTYSRR